MRIGVSSTFFHPDEKRNLFKTKTLSAIELEMADYIGRADVIPVLVPDVTDGLLCRYLDHVDGLILVGGADISPGHYLDEADFDNRWMGDAVRDAHELKMLGYAVERNLPILGICRGMQLLNVFFGGTLHPDIKVYHEGAITHRSHSLYDGLVHPIEMTPNTWLADCYPGHELKVVNSIHHQGVNKLSDKFEVAAVCPEDKLIEGIIFKDFENHPIVGVQWHPEFHTAHPDKLDPDVLIHSFVKLCQEKGQ